MPDVPVSTSPELNLNFPVYPDLQLTGFDGNAMSIVGRARDALANDMREAGHDSKEIAKAKQALTDLATAGDYDHLLKVMINNFAVS